MTSASSSKKEEDLTFSFGDTGGFYTLPAGMLMLLWLYEKCLVFVQTAIKSDWSLWMRKTAGAVSCACVLTYVAGYTCGYWLHQLNAKLTRLVVRRNG